jgi:serine/threonine-protein kinase RsbW
VAAAAELEPTFRDDRIDDLRLAVSEATTNAVEAHLDAGGSDRIVVRCDLGDDRIDVEIRDQGGGFDREDDPLEGAMPDPEARDRLERERGLGLPLMAHLADETEITSRDGGTSVRLTVFVPARFRTPPAADDAEG